MINSVKLVKNSEKNQENSLKLRKVRVNNDDNFIEFIKIRLKSEEFLLKLLKNSKKVSFTGESKEVSNKGVIKIDTKRELENLCGIFMKNMRVTL
jgi:hypothetical protein